MHFYLSLGVAFVVCFVYALYRNYVGPWEEIWFNKWVWHYTDFTEIINIHPLYLSLYVNVGLVMVLLDFLGMQPIFSFGKRTKIAILLMLMVFMVLLSSRWIIVVTVVVAGTLFLMSGRRTSILWGLGVFFLFGVLILSSPVTRERFLGAFNTHYEGSSYKQDRLVIWSTAMDYVMKHPREFIFGKGTGGGKKLMEQQYEEKKISWDFPQKTNTHNQYLGFFLDTGLIGLAWFVIFLAASVRKFFTERNWIGFTFMISFALSMIAENYLQRQKGVVFFAVIFSVLYFSNPKVASRQG